MSSIVTEQGMLHYETVGRGRPIILLHGWINSWDVWREAMLALSSGGRYRLYALDFWGFGDSAKDLHHHGRGPSYHIAGYVDMVRQFMDVLGIEQAPIFGHSMGGTVALQFALTNPARVRKVAVVGSPINGDTLNPALKLAGHGLIADLLWRFPSLLSLTMRILLAGDSKQVRDMIFRDVQRTTMESFFRSIGDLRDTDLSAQLANLDIPALGVYGARDNIVSPHNATLLAHSAHASQIAMMNKSRHFPMTDEPGRFVSVMSHFLADVA